MPWQRCDGKSPTHVHEVWLHCQCGRFLRPWESGHERPHHSVSDKAIAFLKQQAAAEGFSSADVYNHLIFYLPIDSGIEVIRVMHGALDLPAILEQQPYG